MGAPSVCLESLKTNRKENTMALAILNLESGKILRAFMTGDKNKEFSQLLQKGRKP